MSLTSRQMRKTASLAALGLALVSAPLIPAQSAASKTTRPSHASLDHDLPEITIPKLQQLYRARKVTVTQVVNWYIAHIRRITPSTEPSII